MLDTLKNRLRTLKDNEFWVIATLDNESRALNAAFREQTPEPVREAALHFQAAGADIIRVAPPQDISDPGEALVWATEIVIEAINASPVVFPIIDPETTRSLIQRHPGPLLPEGITADPEIYQDIFPVLRDTGANGIVHLTSVSEGIPKNEKDRLARLVEIISVAEAFGIPNERIWIDAVTIPVAEDPHQPSAMMNIINVLHDIAPGVMCVGSVLEISEGLPDDQRPVIDVAFAALLALRGVNAAIVGLENGIVIDIAHGRRADILDAVRKTTAGNPPAKETITPELYAYVRATDLILGNLSYPDFLE